MVCRKKPRIFYSNYEEKSDPFENLPDDLVITILSKLSSSSSSSCDFITALIVCKRFNRLCTNQVVLSKANSKVFAIKPNKWCESAHRFLKLCVNAGSVEASYFLGMIRFYCMENRESGASLMAKAAIRGHAPALYSLAVIQFNGSGGAKQNKDLRAGVALCARAAYLGHVDALRELGHCLQDGYGVKQNVAEGRRLLIQANARELQSILPHVKITSLPTPPRHVKVGSFEGQNKIVSPCEGQKKIVSVFGSGSCSLLSDFGCNVPAPKPHPANRFLVEWFEMRGGVLGQGKDLRMCSHTGCGRPETRPHEFRRCSVCGTVNYCSRGCQALDWKLRHKEQCFPMGTDQWLNIDPQFGMVGAQQDGHQEVVS